MTLMEKGYQFTRNYVADNIHDKVMSGSSAAPVEGAIFDMIDPGADRDEGSATPETIEHEYGTFELKADGSWSLVPDSEKVAQIAKADVVSLDFEYADTDGDGDSIPGTIRVNIVGENENVESAEADVPASEAASGEMLVHADDDLLDSTENTSEATEVQTDATESASDDSENAASGDEAPDFFLNDGLVPLENDSDEPKPNASPDSDIHPAFDPEFEAILDEALVPVVWDEEIEKESPEQDGENSAEDGEPVMSGDDIDAILDGELVPMDWDEDTSPEATADEQDATEPVHVSVEPESESPSIPSKEYDGGSDDLDAAMNEVMAANG